MKIPTPHPHPFKASLRVHHINQFNAAKFLGISQSALSQFLLGYRPFPCDLERKLGKLLSTLKKQKWCEDE